MATILERVKIRIELDEFEYSDALLGELIQTVSDRVVLRVGAVTLPASAESLVVDATVKLLRRQFYEGISSEGASEGGSVSTTFVEDILGEYQEELSRIREQIINEGGGDLGIPTLRFI